MMAGQEGSRGPHARRRHVFSCRLNKKKKQDVCYIERKKEKERWDLKEWWNGDCLRWMERKKSPPSEQCVIGWGSEILI